MTHMPRRIFVYGTLKRGRSNHAFLSGQTFVGEAQTRPRYRLFDLGGYPGMIEVAKDGRSIRGEVWDVDADCLQQLDVLEDVEGGEYVRVELSMEPPHDVAPVQGYLYLWSIASRPEVGVEW